MIKRISTTNVFYLLLILLFSQLASTQNLPKENYSNFNFFTSKNGLYTEKTTAITQDSLGFLWLGTADGLFKYDGRTFSAVNGDSSTTALLKSTILAIYKDKYNNLWIGCSNGLIFYSYKTGTFKEINGFKDLYVSGITQDEDGKIWLVTATGVSILSKDFTISKPPSLKIHIQAILKNPFIKGRAFIVMSDRITEIETKTLHIVKETYYTKNSEHYTDYSIIDSLGQIWIGRFNGEVIKFDSKTSEIKQFDFKTQFNHPSSRVTGIFCNSKEKVWFATDETGIVYYDYNTSKFEMFETPKQNHLPSYKATTFYIDQENNYWFGLDKYGLVMTNSYLNSFNFFDNTPFGKNKIISAILRDSNGNLWIGTDGGGIFQFDQQYKLLNKFKNNPNSTSSISNDAIQTIFEDSKKQIWVGTFKGGLSLLSKKTNSFTNFLMEEGKENWLLRNDIRKIQEDSEGNLWLAVQGKGVSSFNFKNKKFTNYDSYSYSGLWTNDILISKEEDIWITSSNGIFRKRKTDKNFIQLDKEKKSLKETFTNCLYQDTNGKLWIGSLHGLYYYDSKNNKFIKIINEPLLESSSVRSINQDQLGNYFIGTNNGLFRYNDSTHNVDYFGMGDGLKDQTFIINSTFKLGNTLYFGTSNGFCWFDATKIKNVKPKANIYLTNIKIKNTSIKNISKLKLTAAIELLTSLELDYTDNYLTFDFAFPSYIVEASKLNYEYKLEGYDNQWQSTNGQKSVTFTSIPPGNYILNVRESTNNFLNNNDNLLKLKLTILPPYYQTWWFRALILVFLVILVLLYLNFKTKQLQKRNIVLESKINERTIEIKKQNEILEQKSNELLLANTTKDKLFSIIAHDLRSPFTAILTMSEILKDQLVDTGTEKTNELTKGLLKASKNAYQVLENLLQWAQLQTGRLTNRPEWMMVNQSIHNSIDIASLQCSEKNINIDFDNNNDFYAYMDRVMFETIIRNLINNSIKFSFQNSTINIKVNKNDKGFTVSIIDYGIGMSEKTIYKILNENNSNTTTGTTGEIGTGIGLMVVKEFIEFQKSTWEIDSKINEGTKIKIQFNIETKYQTEDIIQNFNTTKLSNHANEIDTEKNLIIDENIVSFLKGKQVLIVDDQEEIRKSISLHLQDKVDLIEACNGKEALSMAIDNLPDIIISDIVMPEMNGIEFSKKIKNNINTAHIPIILLTSQNEEKDVISGLESGVDDYLLKPFNPSILILKITNLLRNREKTKKKFSLEDEALLETMKADSLDKKFYDKIQALIQENISNEEFSVEKISSEMGMHRSNLTKKIATLTGMTPNELIKVQRMKYAAKLLLSSGKNVSEVSYEVGYSDPKYFSKSFKKYFGVLPTEYKNESTS